MGGAGNWVEVGDLLTPHGAWARGVSRSRNRPGSRLPRTGVDSELCAILWFPNNPLRQLQRKQTSSERGLAASARKRVPCAPRSGRHCEERARSLDLSAGASTGWPWQLTELSRASASPSMLYS